MADQCTEEKHKRLAASYDYCFDCGKSLRTLAPRQQYPPCPKCGKTTHKSWNFCGWCGYTLTEKSNERDSH